MAALKPLVIIPTYNELENVANIVGAVRSAAPEVSVLVVDDSSPDGTGAIVQKIAESDTSVHLLTRPQKQGLGRAYIAGFEWGLSHGFNVLVEMDADFSHRPQDLVQILNMIKGGADFVVGSRYTRGGQIMNWGLVRKLISRGGSIYSRLILGYPLKDWTGGFNAWTDYSLQKIHLPSVFSNGYSFQIELKFRALKAGCKYQECPIVFEDRRAGHSKMSSHIVLEAFWRVWKMRIGYTPPPATLAPQRS
jgi:dolichol-phosphate mannosyltransferase